MLNIALSVLAAIFLSTLHAQELGTLNIQSEPSGALVYINDTLVGNAPYVYEGPVGSSRLKLELEGFNPVEKLLNIEMGGKLDLKFKMNPKQ